MYWQGSLLVGLVGSNVETKFNNLDVSTSDSSKESPLQLLIFTWPGPKTRELKLYITSAHCGGGDQMSCKGASAHRLWLLLLNSTSSHCQCDVRELRLRVVLGLKFQWGTPTTLCVDIRLSAR